MRVLGLCFLLFATQATATPLLGPPRPVTPMGTEGQSHGQVAGDGAGFIVVWQAGVGRNAKVRAGRLDATGSPLDAAGFTVSEGTGGRFEPAVSVGHGITVVTWSDFRNGSSAIYASRLSGSQVLDPSGIPVSVEPGARMSAVAPTPNGFLVVWAQAAQGGNGTEVHARLLDRSAMPLGLPKQLTSAQPWTFGEDFKRTVLARAYAQNLRLVMRGDLATVIWNGNAGNSQSMEATRLVLDTASDAVVQRATRAMPPPQSRVWSPAAAGLPDGGILLSWTDPRGRGVKGLESHNALVSTLEADAGVTLVSLSPDGGARQVLWPSAAPTSLIAFVQSFENPRRDRRMEWRLVIRQIQPNGESTGPDVTVAEEVAWPALATNSSGQTILITTTINGAPGQTGRLVARLVSTD